MDYPVLEEMGDWRVWGHDLGQQHIQDLPTSK